MPPNIPRCVSTFTSSFDVISVVCFDTIETLQLRSIFSFLLCLPVKSHFLSSVCQLYIGLDSLTKAILSLLTHTLVFAHWLPFCFCHFNT